MFKAVLADSQLFEDAIEQGRANVAAAMDWDCGSAAVAVDPTFVAPRLA